jgi:hypothetical protein
MKKFEITKNMTRAFGKAGLTCKKYAPEALVIAGIVGVVTSAVMACKATTKVNDIIEETKENTHDLHLVATAAGLKEATDEFSNEDIRKIDILSEKEDVKNYTAQDLKKDTTIIYTQTAVKFIKLYGPSVVLGALSITSILASNNILRKRNVALAAAYATVDKGFKEYRSRVVERFGKDMDRELKYNIKAKEIEETTKNAKGKEKTVKKSIEVADVNEHSDHARFFDELCTGWKRDAEYNLMFLKHQQNYANEKLQKQGYLFLNDVYDMLGIPKTKAGQVVGWIYDEAHPDIYDNFVDFGIYDLYNEKARDFVNGREKSILLDFNVDGNILDLI